MKPSVSFIFDAKNSENNTASFISFTWNWSKIKNKNKVGYGGNLIFYIKRAINLVSVHVLTNLQNSEDKLIRLDISWSSKCLNELPFLTISFKFRPIFGISVGIIINTPAWMVFLERGFTRVILTTSKNCEFKELLISWDLMEIELNRVHFRRLCFF